MCERWVGDRTKTATYWPSNSSGYNSISFLFSWAAQPRAWGPSLCWDMVFIPASSLQLIWTSCRRGYIIIWRPPTSCECHHSHSIQPINSQGYPPISLTGCTCYLHRCISHLIARLSQRSICNIRTMVFIVGTNSYVDCIQWISRNHCLESFCDWYEQNGFTCYIIFFSFRWFS